MDSPGLLGDIPDSFIKNVFWCNVLAVGQTWHRLIRKFTMFPWRLAVVSDGDTTDLRRSTVAREFLSANECCLCEGYSKPLRELVGEHCRPDDLLPGGKWYLLIKSSFQCLPFNVSVENAFARMKNQQRTSRGRNDVTHTLAAKHVLSEVKSSHLVALKALPKTIDTDTTTTTTTPLPLQNAESHAAVLSETSGGAQPGHADNDL